MVEGQSLPACPESLHAEWIIRRNLAELLQQALVSAWLTYFACQIMHLQLDPLKVAEDIDQGIP